MMQKYTSTECFFKYLFTGILTFEQSQTFNRVLKINTLYTTPAHSFENTHLCATVTVFSLLLTTSEALTTRTLLRDSVLSRRSWSLATHYV